MLNDSGMALGKDRVQRIWRREGLRVPQKQPKRSRLWLNDGSCIRLRPEHPNHVWSFDFVEAATHDGRRIRLMTLIDEFTRKCLAIRGLAGSTPLASLRRLAGASHNHTATASIRRNRKHAIVSHSNWSKISVKPMGAQFPCAANSGAHTPIQSGHCRPPADTKKARHTGPAFSKYVSAYILKNDSSAQSSRYRL